MIFLLVSILSIMSCLKKDYQTITTGMEIKNLTKYTIRVVYIIPYDYHDVSGAPLWDEEHMYPNLWLDTNEMERFELEEGDYNIKIISKSNPMDWYYVRVRHHLHVKEGYITPIDLKNW
jgi:hypothetical protein